MGQDAFRQALAGNGVPRGGAIGYLCSYTPEELILAAGLQPVRLFPPGGPPGPADTYLQSFACPFARGCLDAALRGEWDWLAGVVFPYTCDSLRAVAEVWRMYLPARSLFFINLPLRVEGEAAQEYAAREFERFRRWLEGVAGGPVVADAIHSAVRLAGSLREALAGSGLAGRPFLEAAMGAQVMDRLAALELLALPDEAGVAGGTRILVAGGALETPVVLRELELAGAAVVGDDLCVGSRYVALGGAWGDVPPPNPVAELARAYLARLPCPAKHPAWRRLDALLEQVAALRAEGVVFLLQKFCESHAFDLPYLRAGLAARQVPSLALELEQGTLPRGQTRTRVEAFLETLGGGDRR
ncbi:MAG: 2-hydroxyacyl-CoA dehydratase family protein [bacterium]|nr:2-hydroxyacyl-CoA dehydratase family protein [bacterium]